ncbi:ced-6 [Drosophila busckii]|uniref:Ced-6 n=1 Tax=Drosophila busckii TaxID=30019 RepID=A0A0M4EE91_DROBS|nr:ced-6 [Drosophila busckii]
MKKAETGTQEKYKKLEITISIKGVAIQEPRTHQILHQFPLYNISYCADEKGVKKFFSFIAKTVKNKDSLDSNGYNSSNGSTKSEETHECFVFISNKLASDITLTIGQAFDLAYRKYMDSNEKTNLNKAQQQIEHLQQTIAIYKERLRELSNKLPKAELDAMLFKLGIKDITEAPSNELNGNATLSNGKLDDDKLLIDTNSSSASTHSVSPSSFLPIVPPRNLSSQMSSSSSGGGGGGGKSNSQKMDELLLNSDSDMAPPPKIAAPRRSTSVTGSGITGLNGNTDLFGSDPFEMNNGPSVFKPQLNIDDFSLESLDPLRK